MGRLGERADTSAAHGVFRGGAADDGGCDVDDGFIDEILLLLPVSRLRSNCIVQQLLREMFSCLRCQRLLAWY